MNQVLPAHFADHMALDEETRLNILGELGILDTPDDGHFDTITRLAALISGCKISLVSLVDSDRQWFKSRCGLSVTQTPRADAFCAHAIAQDAVMIVPDARSDPRFSANPLVTGAPNIIFYAGIPLMCGNDSASPARTAPIGTLCVIHDKPHALSGEQIATLIELARLVEAMIAQHSARLKAATLAAERTEHLRRLDLINRQFHQAERMANIGSWRLTLADNKTEWSEQVYEIHGLPVGQQPKLDNALDFYPGEARATIANALNNTVATGQPFDVETDFVTAHGNLKRVRSMGEVELKDGHPVAVVGVFQDITRQHGLEVRLRRSAHYDDLTGLPNRAYFSDYFQGKIESSEKNGDPLAVALLDLDGFKSVNDNYGHSVGDLVLVEFAKRLALPDLHGSFCARLGGDEFVIVITDHDRCRDLRFFLTRLLTTLRVRVPFGDIMIEISATIGVSEWCPATANKSDLLHQADMSLYAAKTARRGSAKITGCTDFIFAPD